MKICIVVGTMPDFIKQAPIVWKAEERGHDVQILHTGQHYDKELFLNMFKSLKLRNPNILLTDFSIGSTIERITEVLKGLKPDIVLVHGDTKTAMAGAIAAHFLAIPVGHVEAGLRTKSREPWPEQTDTRIADACSNLFFAATEKNKKDLLNEGFREEDILVCGNTVVDIALEKTKDVKEIPNSEKNQVYFSAHREENMRFDERFNNIVAFANYLASRDWKVNWVMRPKTKQKIVGKLLHENINIISNLPYDKNIELVKQSKFVCTDSGGLQEEASALHIPCLTLRYVTDRPETITAGCNKILTLDFDKMKKVYHKMLEDYHYMRKVKCPYGDGKSAEKIVKFIEKRKNNMIRWEGKE